MSIFTEPHALKDTFEAQVYKRLLSIADKRKTVAEGTNDDVEWTIFEHAEHNASQWAAAHEERIWKYV